MEHVEVQAEPDGLLGATRYRRVGRLGEPIPGPTIVVIAVMHGNEPVGLGVLERLAEVVAHELRCGTLWTVRANVEASAVDLRHTPDGTDMNRLWDPDTLERLHRTAPEQLCYEERRALELAPILLAADAVLDLHSTSRPSAPFVVFRDDQRHAALARSLGVAHLVTGLHENGILSGGVASNVGLRPGEHSRRLGLTFEAGQHTDPGNTERAWLVALRFLHHLGVWNTEPPRPEGEPGVYEVTERFLQAREGRPPWRFVGYEGGEAGAGRRGPLRRLHSFEEVQADEVVVRRGEHGVSRAHNPFTMLMPAPTTAPGTDLYYVTQPRHGGLTLGEQRTDEAARGEAIAIERMLDLLADDDFVTGTSWVAFDSRRLFDLCASIIGRNVRLPEGHPHRRLIVVGRGDAPSDDPSERRETWRYRRAMQIAMAEGIPVERFQLLRGASLSWLDALTSRSMLELLERRHERVGDEDSVRLRISLRQPHTASVLVAGDLDLALESGDTRYVRVALLVEAASVEPDGPSVRVRVLRTGIVSARREILLAARRLLASLREEHTFDLEKGALRGAGAVQALLAADGAIRAVPDPKAMTALRSDLYKVQLGLWCDQLHVELKERVHLPDDGAVGRWLARVMSRTGILDVDGLYALAVRREGDGWVADPEVVARLEDRLRSSSAGDALPGVLFGPPPVHSPPQPLMARDVTADDLERWVGWKRFVRGSRTVPDTRGKDFDLAFSGGDIRDRLVRWYRDAVAKARREDREVLVVVAGDGMNPGRDLGDRQLYDAHTAVVTEPSLHYLRFQHAQGAHLAWMKDLTHRLLSRPSPSRPVALQWELEHGDTVSIVLVAERAHGERMDVWSLEGWSVQRCAVILSDLQSTGEDYEVGLFTEEASNVQGANQELLAFGRAHCERMISLAAWRAEAPDGALDPRTLDACLTEQIARWIERVRVWRSTSSTVPDDLAERAEWVARRLGLKDPRLARHLAAEMVTGSPAASSALAYWEAVAAWPGETPATRL